MLTGLAGGILRVYFTALRDTAADFMGSYGRVQGELGWYGRPADQGEIVREAGEGRGGAA